jgi:hypothetical protein
MDHDSRKKSIKTPITLLCDLVECFIASNNCQPRLVAAQRCCVDLSGIRVRGIMLRSTFPKRAQQRAGAAGFRAECGQALIESIVTFGLLITLIVGIVNFGFIFRTLISITNAANVGAAYASANTGAASDLNGIRAAALGEFDPASTGWNCESPVVASRVTTDGDGNPSVEVGVACTVVSPIALPIMPDRFTVSHAVTRRILP